MAGTVTETICDFAPVKEIRWAWTSGVGADAGKADKISAKEFFGTIKAFVCIPDGVDVPTNLFDVRVLDDDGVDVIEGKGANLVNNAVTVVTSKSAAAISEIPVVSSHLTLEVRNAGDTKKGVCMIRYI